jgi:hypothetical protein
MSCIAQTVRSLERLPENFTVEALAAVLPQAWVHDAVAASGCQSRRRRRLPAVLTVWVVALLGLFRRLSYVNLLEMLFESGLNHGLWKGAPPCSSALTKARDRVGCGPLKKLYERSAREWQSQTAGRDFHGRRVLAIDGSTMKVPDTPENRTYFGAPGASRGRAGYPQLRVVGLRDVGTRLYRAMRFGPYSKGEVTLARDLIDDVAPGLIVLADRNFGSFSLMWDLCEKAVDFVIRIQRGHFIHSRVVEQLGPGDAIVEITPNRDLRRSRRDLPQTWLVREITYRPAQAKESVRLFTSLLLAEEISRDELIALYPDRWEEETGYDELKTHLCSCTTVNRPVVLRSKLPHRVEQELYGLLIAYNAVRVTIALAAAIADCPPRRVSFTTALERIREAVRDMMQLSALRLIERYHQLLAAISRVLVPLRPNRSNPREVKIKMSNYPLKRPALSLSPRY